MKSLAERPSFNTRKGRSKEFQAYLDLQSPERRAAIVAAEDAFLAQQLDPYGMRQAAERDFAEAMAHLTTSPACDTSGIEGRSL
jgi:hypothetical protein